MTTSFGPSPTDTQGALPTLTNLNAAIGPVEFANICRTIVTQHEGHAAHRLLDREVTNLLSSLGYGEGMEIFLAHVGSYHTDEEDELVWVKKSQIERLEALVNYHWRLSQ